MLQLLQLFTTMSSPETHYIAVMGTLGIGKSTATDLLAKEFGAYAVNERPDKNSYLSRFYNDPKTYAFLSQMWFLLDKAKRMRKVPSLLRRKSVIQDTPIQQDVSVYATAHHESGNIDEDHWKLYLGVFAALEPNLPKPELIVFLSASIDTIMARIARRGRDYEKGIPRAYIERLNEFNLNWMTRNTKPPVLFVETDGLDIVQNRAAQKQLIFSVEERLKSASIEVP